MSNPGIIFDESMLICVDFKEEDIIAIADECDRFTKIGFLPELEAPYLGLILHMMDLTSLNSTDNRSTTEALVDKALTYTKTTLLTDIKQIKNSDHLCSIYEYFNTSTLTPATICVSSVRVIDAIQRLRFLKQTLDIASVAGGFPMGQVPLSSQIAEVEFAISHGASEIDIVIDRGLVIDGDFKKLYNNLRAIKSICNNGEVLLKTILSVSEIGSYSLVYKTAMTAMMAGSDFIKTSTGKEAQNATLCHGVVMCEAIKTYCHKSGYQVGIKAAGGIKFYEQAISWLVLVKNQLGNDWLKASLFRIGASSLLEDVVKRLKVVLKKFQ
ncbi:Aldolase-type TIM barrel,DeoC/FbaB/ lacD aldolase,Deoxyribose-phosphate aldolase [Cinara cedri]|uniref:deoxyribose-phosphate aldolase n=1 Tax=Cinara cedri TaxID=506608 RepID=A0A5E4LZR3_9HEMI|nr:Aldolase-type TIM barrel,DeoC/FbaB/ lacD aldolase,Deoxyribose-phosphate aldolase [Cinara cedri]